MMKATHFLTQDIGGVRHRYFGGWSDERFHSLPYIKEYGHVPPGWHAHHLTAEEMQARNGPRWEALKTLPVVHDVEADLARELRLRQVAERQSSESQQFWAAVALAPTVRRHS